MPNARGLRAHTRDKFSKSFRKHGMPTLSRYLIKYKRGDFVDIIADPAIQKGMPYSYYHGRTGIVFNVTPNAIGVEINKVVGNRQMKKRMHLRTEHIRPSKCREEFLTRVRKNDAIKKECREKGEKPPCLKRQPVGPRAGYVVKNEDCAIEVLSPLTYVEHYV